MWGALSDERMGLPIPRVTVSSNKSVVSMFNLHFICYSQSVSLGVEPNLGLMTRYLFLFDVTVLLLWVCLLSESFSAVVSNLS
jgi:hypothetical protein